MTANVRTATGRLDLQQHDDGAVSITLCEPDGAYPNTQITARTDLLAVVAAECDVVIIDRADLPEVTPERPGYSGYIMADDVSVALLGSAEQHRVIARRHLATAEYMDAHPPVDEADVEALTAAAVQWQEARGLTPDHGDNEHAIRALLATGLVAVTR